MKANLQMVLLGLAATTMLWGCDNNNNNPNTSSEHSAALTSIEQTANAEACDSFTPSTINGQVFPQDPAGQAPTALNGAPSPLNCTPGM
jgi:hypothetical protein